MRALLSESPGGPESLVLRDIPDPTPGPGELLVRVRASAINFPDVLIIEDKYQLKPQRPFAPGGEIAGEVIGVGEGVTGWSVGDRLIAALGFGGLAEQVIVPAERAIPLPAERSFEHGSALLMTYATAIHALVDRGKLQAGQTLLVLGAAGGVGIAAVEIGKALGARVIAAASSSEKAEAAGEAGADLAIVYPGGPFDRDGQKALSGLFKDAVGPAGADVDSRPGRRRLYRGGAEEHRLGRALPRGRLPGRNREAAAQPHPPQELRRVRGVLGRVRGARPEAQRGACRAAVPLVGRGQDRAQDQRHLSARASRRSHRRAARPQGRRQAGGDTLKLAEWRASRSARAVFWAAVGFAFVMAVLPHPPQVPGEPNDKVQHVVAFATLALLGSFAYPRTSLLKLLVSLSLFGALIEVVQAIPALQRDSDVLDWLADTAAAAAVLLLVRWWRSRA